MILRGAHCAPLSAQSRECQGAVRANTFLKSGPLKTRSPRLGSRASAPARPCSSSPDSDTMGDTRDGGSRRAEGCVWRVWGSHMTRDFWFCETEFADRGASQTWIEPSPLVFHFSHLSLSLLSAALLSSPIVGRTNGTPRAVD